MLQSMKIKPETYFSFSTSIYYYLQYTQTTINMEQGKGAQRFF